MPPKPLPKKTLAQLKRRFREIVDWAFDGSTTLAARSSACRSLPYSSTIRRGRGGSQRLLSDG
jgi:hypothetical protein